jgi:acetyltransferase-like isoleucine patch superfamily enzyme
MISRGKYTYGEPTVVCAQEGTDLVLGNFCSIAQNVTVYLGGDHRVDWVSTYPFGHIHQSVFDLFDGKGHPASKGNVIIGNDIWIGNGVTIMSGVTIGDGAVIAGGSRVVKDVGAYTLVGGNPARYIRHRFKPDQIEALLEIKWWNWSDDKINSYVPLLCDDNVDAFIESAKAENETNPGAPTTYIAKSVL